MLKDLLVHVDSSESGRRRTRFALAFAASLGARLSGLHVTPPTDVPPLYKPGQVDLVAQQLTAWAIQEADSAEALFREEASEFDGASWYAAQGDVVDGICQHAQFADMVILGQYERQGSPQRHPFPIAHATAVRCGRPVMVVPADLHTTSLSRIAVAWDGSRESTRALHDSLPLLRQAQSVEIVTVLAQDNPQASTGIARLHEHLRRHGIESVQSALGAHSADEHGSLRQHLARGPYDLVVMGAYSHPVWMEFVFGGASESILMSSTVPVVVSH